MKVYHLLNEKAIIHGVKDPRELQHLEKVVDFLMDSLNIRDCEVNISFNPPYDLDKTQFGATIGLGHKPKKVFVFIDSALPVNQAIGVLAHEMVHVHQLNRGSLEFTHVQQGRIEGKWDGEDFVFKGYSKSNPWEVEAYTTEKTLRALVVDKIGNYNP